MREIVTRAGDRLDGGEADFFMKEMAEERALALLVKVLDIDRQDRDALSGEVVAHVKDAVRVLRRRRDRRNRPQ